MSDADRTLSPAAPTRWDRANLLPLTVAAAVLAFCGRMPWPKGLAFVAAIVLFAMVSRPLDRAIGAFLRRRTPRIYRFFTQTAHVGAWLRPHRRMR